MWGVCACPGVLSVQMLVYGVVTPVCQCDDGCCVVKSMWLRNAKDTGC